jgi:hypothetical protein
LQKRGGSRKQNNTQLGDGADVNAVYEYKKSDGTDYCVAFSSSNGYYSTDNCATFTSFFSSFTVNQDMNCVPFTDRLYCVNGVDDSFYFDGTKYTAVAGMPAGKYLRAYQNRLWLAGYRVVFEPLALTYHRKHATGGRLFPVEQRYALAEARDRMAERGQHVASLRLKSLPPSKAVRDFIAEGKKVVIHGDDGNEVPAIFVGEGESSTFFGGPPMVYVVVEGADQPVAVELDRVTAR